MQRKIAFFVLAFGIAVVGCNDKETPKGSGSGSTTGSGTSVASGKPGHDHSGWWCKEHGIPEEDCLVCKIGEQGCKDKKDWCEIHDYCKSQCFGCNPKLKERYAAQYKAKYNKEAPEPTENPPTKNPEPKKK